MRFTVRISITPTSSVSQQTTTQEIIKSGLKNHREGKRTRPLPSPPARPGLPAPTPRRSTRARPPPRVSRGGALPTPPALPSRQRHNRLRRRLRGRSWPRRGCSRTPQGGGTRGDRDEHPHPHPALGSWHPGSSGGAPARSRRGPFVLATQDAAARQPRALPGGGSPHRGGKARSAAPRCSALLRSPLPPQKRPAPAAGKASGHCRPPRASHTAQAPRPGRPAAVAAAPRGARPLSPEPTGRSPPAGTAPSAATRPGRSRRGGNPRAPGTAAPAGAQRPPADPGRLRGAQPVAARKPRGGPSGRQGGSSTARRPPRGTWGGGGAEAGGGAIARGPRSAGLNRRRSLAAPRETIPPRREPDTGL
ncbi:unnamed protein product, partial [Coccothraustes coccothraustes]